MLRNRWPALFCVTLIAAVALIPGPSRIMGNAAALEVLVPVVAFPTIADDLNWEAFLRYWQGDAGTLPAFTLSGERGPVLIVSQPTFDALRLQFGSPASNVLVDVIADESQVAALWRLRPAALGIVPFDQLVPAEKALSIDGTNALLPDADLSRYPLALPLAATDAITNRDLSKLTVLVMTGTTAITRTMAYAMEKQADMTFPAADVLPFLRDADFIHTSNELAFAPDCPYPDPQFRTDDLLFCSRESYFALLQAIHLNIVELTGNHVNDWGTDAFAHTLDLYASSHIGTFGGGRNRESSLAPLIVQHNGTTIALIGCNMAGPRIAWATDTLPGAAPCDNAYFDQELPKLKAAHDFVIMTIQYLEYDIYTPPPEQVTFFQHYADLGADVVFGSQAHHPQAFAFGNGLGGAFIDYGTGNLFFDQMNNYDVRQMRMDKLILYDGRLLNVLLFTGLRQGYSHTPAMTDPQRAQFLNTVFAASGW